MTGTQGAVAVDTAPAEPERRSTARRVVEAVGVQNASLLIALALLVTIIGVQDPNFFGYNNLLAIGKIISVGGLLAISQTVVIILGGLDISVGSMTGLCSVATAMVFMESGTWAGLAAAVAVGLAAGLVNGLIVVYGRVNPVVATLATLAAFKGIAQLIADGRAQGYTGDDDVFIFISRGKIAGIPTLIWVLVVVAVVVHVMLKYTDVGRNIYAIGGNDAAARLAGINLNRYLIGAYVLSGVVAGIAGILLTARTGSGQPVSGSEGLELYSITAAALGGCALQGGKGTIPGTVLALLLLGVLENGLNVVGVNTFWQNVAKGALLVVAVVIQQRRSGERRVGLPR